MNKDKHYRNDKHMSQLTLARTVEVSRQTINMIENNKYKYCRSTLNFGQMWKTVEAIPFIKKKKKLDGYNVFIHIVSYYLFQQKINYY